MNISDNNRQLGNSREGEDGGGSVGSSGLVVRCVHIEGTYV